ncbi:MAG: glycosyltransferase [Coriobacteriia bacterium]|nr:glycosyltransferase [Coriobacteriia bacterium]
MSSIWTFLLIWGVWLITPVLVDGAEALARLIRVSARKRERAKEEPVHYDDLPTVSVIVPAHNESAVIDRCLNSVKAQDYPHDKLEIIVIDDGSTDDTADRVEEHVNGNHHYDGNGHGTFLLRGTPIQVGPYRGTLALIKNGHQGKAHALNAGIAASSGDIIVNIDSDVVLAPNAIRAIAVAFVRKPEMGAATGNIEIDWEMLEARDRDGNLLLDENGDIETMKLGPMQSFLARSQFLEYLASFDLGRRAQSLSDTMYTLAGACSAFRRSMVGAGFSYANTTVSEDTLLTFDLHRKGVHIGFVEDARVYLEPVVEWDSLYAQRARWSRGQMEVCGLNQDMIGTKKHGRLGRFALPKMLVFDHTLAFPRLIWAPLLLFFPLLGYPMRVVALAAIGMYIFYLGLEVVNTLAVFSFSDEHTKNRIERSLWALIGLPFYRFAVFHFRFSGFLVTLTEKQQWTMPGPVQQTTKDFRRLQLRSIEIATGLFGMFLASWMRTVRIVTTLVAPLLFGYVLIVRWFDTVRRSG